MNSFPNDAQLDSFDVQHWTWSMFPVLYVLLDTMVFFGAIAFRCSSLQGRMENHL